MIIELTRKPVAVIKDRAVIVTNDAALSFEFKSEYDLSNAVITLTNGGLTKNFKFAKKFDVPNDFMFEGRIIVIVDMYLEGKIAKSWRVPPIRIKEAENNKFGAYDELYRLENALSNLENKLIAVELKLENHIKKSEEII